MGTGDAVGGRDAGCGVSIDFLQFFRSSSLFFLYCPVFSCRLCNFLQFFCNFVKGFVDFCNLHHFSQFAVVVVIRVYTFL